MPDADGWNGDADVARWEALEAEAKERLEGEARQVGTDESSQPSNAAWNDEAPSWYSDAPAEPVPVAHEAQSASPTGPAVFPQVAPEREPEVAPPPFVPEILLADADPAIAASLEQAMTDQGWLVRRVDNGEIAVAELMRVSPHVLVVDYSLPGLGGLDLLRRIAELQLDDAARIVVNSIQTQAVHVQRARAMGANRFLDRPLRGPEKVIEAVAGQIEELIAERGEDRAPVSPAAAPAPQTPEPAPERPSHEDRPAAPVPGLFADSPAAAGPSTQPSVEDHPAGPDAEPAEGDDRSYRSSFGSGGGPPGRIPRLG